MRAWIMITIMIQIDVLRKTDNTNLENKLHMLDIVGMMSSSSQNKTMNVIDVKCT